MICQRCGACCSGRLIVEADALDATREPRLLAADLFARKRGRPRELAELLGDDGRAICLAANDACQFLSYEPDGRARCEIYPTRPNDCVAFEPGGEQCCVARGQEPADTNQPTEKGSNHGSGDGEKTGSQ